MEEVLFAPSVYQPSGKRAGRMQFSSSLKLNHIFRRLYGRGASAANRYLVLYCLKNGTGSNRVGLTVSAKLAGAVGRNRLRRQLREIYRLHEASFARGYDLVVVARSAAVGAPYAALERAYLSLADKLRLRGGERA
jgi:ribonuclease P protein component